jgi:exosome complex exonuclease DIS3/RRP44
MCSLIYGVDRLTFSVLWEVTPDATIVNTNFHKTVIHSQAAMAYSQAQEFIDNKYFQTSQLGFITIRLIFSVFGRDDQHKFGRPIILMNKIAKLLRAARIRKGSLTLASPAVKFIMDSDSQQASDMEMYQLKESHALVEEFMLLANVSVAEFILKSFPQFALLRSVCMYCFYVHDCA